jgi:hypothetical protein
MRTPPLLLGVTLAFWGWMTGFLVIGLLLGIALEASRWLKTRWEFSLDEFNQLWNITVILFLGVAAYAFAMNDGMGTVSGFFNARSFTDRSRALDKAAQTVITFLQWTPMIFFPFTAAQAYSHQEFIDFKTFSWFLRRRARKSDKQATPGKGLNTAYPYFAVCLVSTSTINEHQYVFYPGLCLLVAWALWRWRSPRFAIPIWALLVLLAAVLGFLSSYTLRNLQKIVIDLQTKWISNIGRRGMDAKEAHTAIGQVGKLKGSGKILLRVEIPPEARKTELLREATFTLYRGTAWQCMGGGKKDFEAIYPGTGTNENTWVFLDAPPSNSVKISAYLDGGKGPLAVPHGLIRLDNLVVFDLKTNHVGTARVDSGPGLVAYTARYGDSATFEARPDTTYDMDVPNAEAPAIAQIASELKLAELPEAQRPRALEAFFAKYFSYSLYQEESPASYTNKTIRTPLAHFLLKRRAGHCEYFATATVLLLRQAGIPARYALGYSIQENAGKNRYIVRARHAHAWCLYYDRAAGRWRELDTTPGSWVEAEEKNASFLEPIGDAFSWVWFQISKIRYGEGNLRQYLFYVLVVVLIVLIIRFIWQKRWRRHGKRGGAIVVAEPHPGLDSEFYLIEKKLAKRGLGRRPSEPLLVWLQRIQANLPDTHELNPLINLHYRLRFDPHGLSAADRDALRQQALAWLEHAKGK